MEEKGCTYPLLNVHIESSDWSRRNGVYTDANVLGVATQKGLFFNIGWTLFGRDGVARLVQRAIRSTTCCKMMEYACYARFMAIFDLFQYLIIGSVLFIMTGLCFAISLMGWICLCLILCGCGQAKIKLLWWSLFTVWYGSLGSLLCHIPLYPMLLINCLAPEFGICIIQMHKWGFEAPFPDIT